MLKSHLGIKLKKQGRAVDTSAKYQTNSSVKLSNSKEPLVGIVLICFFLAVFLFNFLFT